MKKKISVLALILAIVSFVFSPVYSQEMKVDVDRTVLLWEGKGVGKSHQGAIKISKGSLTMKDGMPSAGKFVVDMTSITNSDIESENMAARLIGHLKSDDFFGVENFPEATFIIKEAHSGGNGHFHVHGDLTIKGKTHPVEFMTEYTGEGDSGIFSGRLEVDRSLYDVRYGSGKFFDNLGDKAINDIFTLDFELFVKK